MQVTTQKKTSLFPQVHSTKLTNRDEEMKLQTWPTLSRITWGLHTETVEGGKNAILFFNLLFLFGLLTWPPLATPGATLPAMDNF
jgi:hypothetical protein